MKIKNVIQCRKCGENYTQIDPTDHSFYCENCKNKIRQQNRNAPIDAAVDVAKITIVHIFTHRISNKPIDIEEVKKIPGVAGIVKIYNEQEITIVLKDDAEDEKSKVISNIKSYINDEINKELKTNIKYTPTLT